MMKHRIKIMLSLISVGMVGVIGITGCTNITEPNNQKQKNTLEETNTQNDSSEEEKSQDETGESVDGGEVLASAKIFGTVAEFYDTGCVIVQGEQSEDKAKDIAAGVGDEDMAKVIVTYDDRTQFQIALSTTTSVTLEDSLKSELKKAATVYLYGSFQEDGVFLASRVIINRFER